MGEWGVRLKEKVLIYGKENPFIGECVNLKQPIVTPNPHQRKGGWVGGEVKESVLIYCWENPFIKKFWDQGGKREKLDKRSCGVFIKHGVWNPMSDENPMSDGFQQEVSHENYEINKKYFQENVCCIFWLVTNPKRWSKYAIFLFLLKNTKKQFLKEIIN